MSNAALVALEARIDSLSMDVLLPLRTSKTLNSTALHALLGLLRELRTALANEATVTKSLVGKLLFLFTSMLGEASHAREPGPIVAAAWQVEEEMSKIFGPHFE